MVCQGKKGKSKEINTLQEEVEGFACWYWHCDMFTTRRNVKVPSFQQVKDVVFPIVK
jgi:hypothetical protein